MATRVRSYSKINLGLAIGPPRPDGFHGLATLYQTLAMHDLVTVEVRKPRSVGEKQIPPLRSGMTDGGKQIPPLRYGMTNEDGGKQIPPLRYGMTNEDGEKQIPPLRYGMTDGGKQIPPLRYGMTDGEKQIPSPSAHSVRSGAGMTSDGEPARIVLTTNHRAVPTDSRNTAWKMVERALARMGMDVEVHIHIQKELPVQGGMGAGSANAAAALIGLEQELGLKLPEAERLAIAAEVGSDVPLFLIGGAVLGEGRGEVVSAMPDLAATPCVVAIPEVGVSTPRAFQEWDGLCARSREQGAGNREQGVEGGVLTSPAGPDRLEELSHVYASVLGVSPATERTSDTSGIVRGSQGSTRSGTKQGGLEGRSKTSGQGAQDDLAEEALLALVRTGIENDFEQVVFPQYPLLREIKRILMGASAGESDLSDARPDGSNGKALYAALSGSGSALFGLYRSMADARAAQQRVQSSGCKAILTETLPRAEYWGRMFAE